MPDNCIVGRGLVNDLLPGWETPCNEPVTEEFIVPVGLIASAKSPHIPPDQDVWLFCSEHGKQFRRALNDALEGSCN